jgi:KUP system potassium uptake protein
MGHNSWLRNQSHHDQIILLTISPATVPRVSEDEASKLEQLAPDFFRITTQFGFMQDPDITRMLKAHTAKLGIDWNSLVCYLPEPQIIPRGSIRRRAAARIYAFLRRNSLSVADYFQIPPRKIVHVGVRLEI